MKRLYLVLKDGTLILGRAESHTELLPKGKTKYDVLGGGRCRIIREVTNPEKGTLIFYDQSLDFGVPVKSDMVMVKELQKYPAHLDSLKWLFTVHESPGYCLQKGMEIKHPVNV